jgi:hypothetical protein
VRGFLGHQRAAKRGGHGIHPACSHAREEHFGGSDQGVCLRILVRDGDVAVLDGQVPVLHALSIDQVKAQRPGDVLEERLTTALGQSAEELADRVCHGLHVLGPSGGCLLHRARPE